MARARAEIGKNDSGSNGAVTAGPYRRSGAGTPEHILSAINPAISYRLSGARPMGIAFGFPAGRPGRQHASQGFLFTNGNFVTIDAPGAAFTELNAINPEGDILGDYLDVNSNFFGFLLSRGNFIPIGFPGATVTSLNSINPQGDIGYYNFADGIRHGFLLAWDFHLV